MHARVYVINPKTRTLIAFNCPLVCDPVGERMSPEIFECTNISRDPKERCSVQKCTERTCYEGTKKISSFYEFITVLYMKADTQPRDIPVACFQMKDPWSSIDGSPPPKVYGRAIVFKRVRQNIHDRGRFHDMLDSDGVAQDISFF